MPATTGLLGRTRAWSMYDVANSGFVTVVITALGGPFLTALAEKEALSDGKVHLLGFALEPGSVWAYVTSLSVIVQVLLLPLLGAAAEAPRPKHRLLVSSTVIGAVAALLFALLPFGGLVLASLLIVVANVAFGAAIVAYNAYLADVALPEDRDRVSARAFAAGYIGGGVLLVLALAVVKVEPAGLDKLTLVRVCLAAAAVWWGTIGVLAAQRLKPVEVIPAPPLGERLRGTVGELKTTVKMLRRDVPQAGRFLVAFLCFNDAIQAVVALSAVYLTQELYVAKGLPAEDATTFLLLLVLVIQFVAVAGAIGFARLADRIGAKRSLLLSLVGWIAVVLYATLLLDDTLDAWILGLAIAIVLGGSQALARSQFSKLVPAQRQTAAFGLYELAERGTAWIGPLVFALALSFTGSYRLALGMLLVLFVVGTAVLATVDTVTGEAESQELEAELAQRALENAAKGTQ